MSFPGLLTKVEADIERVGWSCIGVMPTVDDPPDEPSFSYTIGLREQGDHPELIIAGLPYKVAHTILTTAFALIKEEGIVFTDGTYSDDLFERYRAVFRSMPPDGKPLNVARLYYGTEELDALQIVWPDRNGWFPGDPECDPQIAQRQDQEVLRR
jgi:hypothetical protein